MHTLLTKTLAKSNFLSLIIDFTYAFNKLNPRNERLLTDFDFDSVMLYGSTSFAKAPGLKTMVAKDGSILPEVYDKSSLSVNDIKRIKMLYEC